MRQPSLLDVLKVLFLSKKNLKKGGCQISTAYLAFYYEKVI